MYTDNIVLFEFEYQMRHVEVLHVVLIIGCHNKALSYMNVLSSIVA